MKRFLLFLLLLPIHGYSQGLEGGSVDNNKNDMIARLVINQQDPANDKPVSDIIEYNETIILYSGDFLYAYDAKNEKSVALIELSAASVKFVQIVSGQLYMNIYDGDGNFKYSLQYDLESADPKNGVQQEFEFELVELFVFQELRYFVVSIGDELRLGYSISQGAAIKPYAGFLLPNNYQLQIDSKGNAWVSLVNIVKPNEKGICYISPEEITKINLIKLTPDPTFAFVNNLVYFSNGGKIIQIGVPTDFSEVEVEKAESPGTKFFTLGEELFGFSSPTKDILIVNTKGGINAENFEVVSFNELIGDEAFTENIYSVIQANADVVSISNLDGGGYKSLILTSKLEVLNLGDDILSDFPPVSAKVFNNKFLANEYSLVKDGEVSSTLTYYDLENKKIVSYEKLIYEDVGYNFSPELANARNSNFVIFNSEKYGFELNILTSNTQSGYLIAEEITNDELSRNTLDELGVTDVLLKYSTYPKKLTVIDNSLFYMAHLASGSYNGYNYLYKVNREPTNILLNNTTVSEAVNTTINFATATANDVDDNELTFSLIGGAGGEDNGLFNFSGRTLRTNGGFNYEEKPQLNIKIRVSDPHGLIYTKAFQLTVTDANDAPTNISLSGDKIGENAVIGDKVANISTEDEDTEDTFTYTLVNDAGGAFTILNDSLMTNQVFDVAVQDTYTIRIRTTDAGSASIEQDFTIGITESNNAPTNIQISNSIIQENAASDQIVGELSTVDPDASDTNFTYELVDGFGSDNNDDFVIDESNNPVVLKAVKVFNFEQANLLKVRIKTTDPKGANYVRSFDINVSDENDAPLGVTLLEDSISENQPQNTVVGTLNTDDVDAGDTFNYSLVSGEGDADNGSFTVDTNSGEVLQAVAQFDFENKSTYSIRVAATDSGGESVESSLSIFIKDENDPPSEINLSAQEVSEESANAIVGEISVVDPDVGDVYSLFLPDTLNNSYFELAAGGLLGLSDALNFENISIPSPLTVAIIATDAGGASLTTAFDINLLDVNDVPDSIALASLEFSPKAAEERICRIFLRDEELGNGLALEYNETDYNIKLANAGTNDGIRFGIEYFETVFYLKVAFESGIEYDSETPANNVFNISLEVEDINHPSGEVVAYTQDFTIEVVDENAPIAPESISLTNNALSENPQQHEKAYVVGELTTEDQNEADTHTYSIVANIDGQTYQNESFKIIEGSTNQLSELSFLENVVLDYNEDSVYRVNIKSTDNDGLSVEQVFTVYLTEYIDTQAPNIEDNQISINGTIESNSIQLPLVISDWELDSVWYEYGPILQQFSKAVGIGVDDYSGTIDVSLDDDDYDAFGTKLRVYASDKSGNESVSKTIYNYHVLDAEDEITDLPNKFLGQGRLTENYRMFSIPYSVELNIRNYLEQVFGEVSGDNTYQVYKYNPTNNTYSNALSLNSFELGKAYWFTTVLDEPVLNFGAGNIFKYKPEFGSDSVFNYQLKQGWNQIGNPYPVALDWASIIDGNSNVGQLHVYNEAGYTTSNTLPVHGGGFVLVQSDVTVPAILNVGANQGREQEDLPFDWKLDFTVLQNQLENNGSIGMHPDASELLDGYDVANPPHFKEFLEIDFNRLDRFYSNYKTDIVGSKTSYLWTFGINSHKPDSPISLSWNNESLQVGEFFLVDLQTLNKIDMAIYDHYENSSGGQSGFKIIYNTDGLNFNLGELLVGKAVPNPTRSTTSIGLNLPRSLNAYHVKASIIDLQGRVINSIFIDKEMEEGYHSIEWDGTNEQGEPAASGIYLYTIKIKGDESGVYTGRILKQN